MARLNKPFKILKKTKKNPIPIGLIFNHSRLGNCTVLEHKSKTSIIVFSQVKLRNVVLYWKHTPELQKYKNRQHISKKD